VPTVRRAREIAAEPERIWRIVSDPEQLPRWWPAVVRVEDASTAAWTSVLRSPKGKLLRADFTRVSVNPERSIVWRQEVEETPFEKLLARASTEIALEPAGDGTTVAITARERLRGLSRLGGFMVRRATRRRLDEALTGLEAIV
jgi:uncharacterized protein YndB with AHSA1/START domain